METYIILTLIFVLILIIFSLKFVQAEEIIKVGKFKDWQVIMFINESNKVCFAQSKPVLQSPKKSDREALIEALNSGKLDVIATDHAPHTLEEKSGKYFDTPAGLPLVQHALPILFDLARKGEITHELIVDKACHAPADLFGVIDRGYVREGYFADQQSILL